MVEMEANSSSVGMMSPCPSSYSTSNSSPTPTPTHLYSCLHPQTPKTPKVFMPMLRLWRPQAQRNVRNQWSKLSSLRQQWYPSYSSGRSHATSLVNSYLSHRYMDAMDLGVLSDMPNIRKKACVKLLKQLVSIVVDMTNASKSMRCFLITTSGSSIQQFSNSSENGNDAGDGGGAPVVTFLSISAFETLAEELVEMYKQELILKRLLVVELFSKVCKEMEQFNHMSWGEELYHGEADDLIMCNLYAEDKAEPILPDISGWKSKSSYVESDINPNHDVLQVYITTWLAEVSIDAFRVEEIFSTVGEELRMSFT
ncbi:uncharacterized protein LOC130800404 isoform X2 [Amaranthus tricolor]|uniref:uncharacterized protein LOC130800404 isoform X2 n=1 Tax=Amaranthus tricolor TaxID=29722 RepID=UPI00258ECD7B|nr:uncharacterized protein LOC130800404 isoform X2 [Amaranthus tricolor]